MKKKPLKKITFKITLYQEEYDRIGTGPCKNTGGRGKASWVAQTAREGLELWEAVQKGVV